MFILASTAGGGWLGNHLARSDSNNTSAVASRVSTLAPRPAARIIESWRASVSATSAGLGERQASARVTARQLLILLRCCKIDADSIEVRAVSRGAFDITATGATLDYLAALSRLGNVRGAPVLLRVYDPMRLIFVAAEQPSRRLDAWVLPELLSQGGAVPVTKRRAGRHQRSAAFAALQTTLSARPGAEPAIHR